MNKTEQLTYWIERQHAGQLIKDTDEPYFNHLLYVAEMVKKSVVLGYEIGLCHDLFEETTTSVNELTENLKRFGYTNSEADHIKTSVVELTDIFTAYTYPHLRKKDRKAREAARLLTIGPDAQTVKYCDLIYNIGWMMKHEKKRAKKYLKKKQVLLLGMVKGNKGIRQCALNLIHIALAEL
jgi:(p)ppGpp synthase/HD superfamily hydrolase